MYCSESVKQYLFSKLRDPFEGLNKAEIEQICIEKEYLFIKRDKKTGLYYGYCTCCHKWSELTALNEAVYYAENAAWARRENDYLHNTLNHCPNCNRVVQIKDINRGRNRLSEKGYCAIWQKLSESILVLRTFAIKKIYGKSRLEDIEAAYSEHYRIFYVKGKGAYPFKRFEKIWDFYADHNCYFDKAYSGYNNFISMKELPTKLEYPTGVFFGLYYCYNVPPLPTTEFFNVKVLDKVKWLKHSQYDNFFFFTNEEDKYLHHKFIEYYIKHPVLCERLMKEGFGNVIALHLVKNYLNANVINYNAKTVLKFFKLNNKAELKALKALCDEKKDSMKVIAKAVNNIAVLKKNSIEITEKSLDFCIKNNLVNFDISKMCTTLGISECSLIKYLIKKNYPLSDYRDYAGWLIKYNFEINNKSRFPRYPKKAHDELMKHNQRMEQAERIKRAKKQAEKTKAQWKNFEKNILPMEQYVINAQNDKYLIRPFENAEEMIVEGTAQHICVGGVSYQEKQRSGKSIICCLRKIEEPETPYCTVEIDNNGYLIQARMAYNNTAPEDVKQFIDSVLKDFAKRKAKYERESKRNNIKKEVA